MLTQSQLADLFDRIGTPLASQKLIGDARAHAPIREVQSRGNKVIAILTSQKMARGIQPESLHFEFAVAVARKHAKDFFEYYAQPCELKPIMADGSCTSSLGSTTCNTPC